ncbi:unnamed protein product [Echinostoma caproni]|uniref:Apple domain-containing protein n=1 Tax=Echinostoma caproni TaxID=27848 RepID=A0A183AD57_9TREM|nr:unnamed protein product [Echinostoma caproni]
MILVHTVFITFLHTRLFSEIEGTNSDAVAFPREVEFCAAHRQCYRYALHDNKTGYMVPIGYTGEEPGLQKSKSMWINLHALLSETSPAGGKDWIYGDMASSSERQSIDPDIRTHDVDSDDRVAFITSNGTIERTNTEVGRHTFACSFREVTNGGTVVRHEKFTLDSTINPRKLVAKSDKTTGCFISYLENTLMHCALRCHLHAMCRSFYYNLDIQVCIQTEFVDSLLSRAEAGTVNLRSWRRFARPQWIVGKSNGK